MPNLKPGIYCFTINNEKYIGETLYLSKRYNQHVHALKTNTHYNQKVQNFFNKYQSFSYEVLIEIKDQKVLSQSKVDIKNLLIRLEQVFFNLFKPSLNLDLGLPRQTKGGWSKSRKQKMRDLCNGRTLSKETRLKMSKPYYLISPEGIRFEGLNLEELSRKLGYSPASLPRVQSGSRLQYKGWTNSIKNHILLKQNKLYSENKEIETIKLFHPLEGTVVIKNLQLWCKEKGFAKQSISRLLKGQRKRAYDYFRSQTDFYEFQNSKHSIFPYVSFNIVKNTWIVTYKKEHVGTFSTEKDAAEASFLAQQVYE